MSPWPRSSASRRTPGGPATIWRISRTFWSFRPRCRFMDGWALCGGVTQGMLPDRRLAGQSLQGRSMRPILDEDFDAIVLAGLGEVLAPENAVRLGVELPADLLAPTPASRFRRAIDRRVERMLVNRTIREASFRLEVCRAYGDTCAVTGLKIVNGGGRAEVQAAHVKPVAAGRPRYRAERHRAVVHRPLALRPPPHIDRRGISAARGA